MASGPADAPAHVPRRLTSVDILFLLVPVSVLLVLGLMALFAWALQSGQFDDLRGEGERILAADGADLDEDQPRS